MIHRLRRAYPGLGVDEIMLTDWATLDGMLDAVAADEREAHLWALETAMAAAGAQAGMFQDDALRLYHDLREMCLTDAEREKIAQQRKAERQARVRRGVGVLPKRTVKVQRATNTEPASPPPAEE